MKILGIICSPRSGGNTDLLVHRALDSAAKEGAEIEVWSVAGKNLKPCDGCRSCIKTGQCRVKDDMQALYPKLIKADGIILGSPVYFWSVTAQAKIIIDRTYALRRPTNRLQGKVGGAIAIAGRRGAFNTLTVMNSFFLGQGMIPTGLGVDGKASAEKGAVVKDESAMTGATDLGKRMVEILKLRR